MEKKGKKDFFFLTIGKKKKKTWIVGLQAVLVHNTIFVSLRVYFHLV